MKNLNLVNIKDEYGFTKKTIIDINGTKVGEDFIVIAGPCSIESEEQIFDIAKNIKIAGANILRGGAYKPRTSPYSFQGLGKEGLILLSEAGKENNIPVITEIMDVRDIDLACEYVDIIQIGARNMQNFSLLKEVGRISKPVLLKRGMNATIEEWLNSAEYILNEGNKNVILCERGIRTFETYTRNTLDLSAVAAVKNLSHLPVIVDPSHATGIKKLVNPMSFSAIMAGCDGLEIEVHPDPYNALSDNDQQLSPNEFKKLMCDLKVVLKCKKQLIN